MEESVLMKNSGRQLLAQEEARSNKYFVIRNFKRRLVNQNYSMALTCISREPNPPSESRIFIKPSNPPMIDSIRDST